MIVQAVLVSLVWLVVVLALDLPRSMLAPGVVIAFALAWRDERKEAREHRPSRPADEDDDVDADEDGEFEPPPPIQYV